LDIAYSSGGTILTAKDESHRAISDSDYVCRFDQSHMALKDTKGVSCLVEFLQRFSCMLDILSLAGPVPTIHLFTAQEAAKSLISLFLVNRFDSTIEAPYLGIVVKYGQRFPYPLTTSRFDNC
jgi:hypothetical protein